MLLSLLRTTHYIRFCNWALTSNTIFHQFHLIVVAVVAACLHIHFWRQLYFLSFGFNLCFFCLSFFGCFLVFIFVVFTEMCFFVRFILHHFMIATGFPCNLASSVVYLLYLSHILPPSFYYVFFHSKTVWWCRTCARRTKNKTKRSKIKAISKFSFVCMSYACIYCV